MKYAKIILLLFLLAVVSYDVQAQRFGRARGGRGGASLLKIGMNINYFSGEFPGEGAPRIGLNLGIAPTIPLRRKLYLKPEVSFSQRGGRIDYDQSFAGFEGNLDYRLSYIDVTLLIGYKIEPLIALEAGGFAAFEVGGNFDFEGSFFTGYGTFDRDDIEDFNYGLAFGIKVGPVGVRYYYGLQEIAAGTEVREFLGNASTHTVQIYFQRAKQRRAGNKEN